MIAVEAVVVLAVWWIERASLKAAEKVSRSIPADSPQPWLRMEMKGILRPPTLPADTAEVADNDEVIGVVAKGKARAYRIKALGDMRQHIVNDVVGGVPVSLAYCGLSQCVRAYRIGGESEPLGHKDDGEVISSESY